MFAKELLHFIEGPSLVLVYKQQKSFLECEVAVLRFYLVLLFVVLVVPHAV